MKTFKTDEWVCHSHIHGRKFKIVREITPSQYEISDPTDGKTYIEPTDCLLGLEESRDNLLKFLLDEN